MVLKEGSILVVETGIYSDYAFTGPFRLLKDLDQAEVIEKFKAEWVPGADDLRDLEDGPAPEHFVPWRGCVVRSHNWTLLNSIFGGSET